MPRVRVQVWGAVVDVFWGMKDGVMEGLSSMPNAPTPMATPRPTLRPSSKPIPDVPDMKQQVINICKGGTLTYTSKEDITKLVVRATPNLLV